MNYEVDHNPHPARKAFVQETLLKSKQTIQASDSVEHRARIYCNNGLYRPIFSTAIGHKTGTAEEKSLRGIEVIVPLTLQVELEFVESSQHPLSAKWIDVLRPALHLIRAVDAHRSRGLGRAVLKLPEAKR